MATPQTTIGQSKQEAHKVLGDTSATMTTLLASIGDRLGLFKDLAANGPGTSAELARRTGTNERYVRELARRHDYGWILPTSGVIK